MDSPVKKTINSFEASHDIKIFDANLSAALSKAIQHGNDDNAISLGCKGTVGVVAILTTGR
jgi:hypothetical protein